MNLETPAEEERKLEKMNKTKDVNQSIDYLRSIFYHYATNVDRYNYTRDEYRDVVYADLDVFKKFVVKYYNEYNVDMTDDWDQDWTFPKALLFTITIMTTVGEYIPSSTIIFRFHFLPNLFFMYIPINRLMAKTRRFCG